MSAENEANYINLYKLPDNTVLLWNKSDIVTVRKNYRIVGKLVGSYPGASRQSIVMTSPLYLTPEEATLLIEKEFAKLYEDSRSLTESTLTERNRLSEEYYSKSLTEQRQLAKETKISEILSKKQHILDGISKKSGKTFLTNAEKEEAINKIIQEIQPIKSENMLIHLPSECLWKSSSVEVTWSYPQTTAQRIRYLVFRELWRNEFYITCGSKFGGDYLVYPGDPDLYHAQYIAVCRRKQDRMVNTEVVQMARLASNVKKTVLICTVDLDTEAISYCKLNYNPHPS